MSKLNPRYLVWREAAIVGIPALLLVLGAIALALYFVKPSPPHELTMSSGSPVSPYGQMGQKFARQMATSGVTLHLPNSNGAAENLMRLRDPGSKVDAGIVQGGFAFHTAAAQRADSPGLVSLGSMTIEPLWVFYRSPKVMTRLSELSGLRIGVGTVGSGTHALAMELLRASGIGPEQAKIYEISPDLSAQSLLRGQLDVVFINSAVDSIAVAPLRHVPDLRLMHFDQAAALIRLYPYLSKVTLPKGTLDLARNLPPEDTDMVATTANLVVRQDLHPALMYLLLDTAQKLQGGHGLFQVQGEYPSSRGQDMELADEAKHFYAGSKPFFQRYLPFWLANLVDRLLVLLIPVLVVLIPVVQFVPTLYAALIKRRVTRWYRALRELESGLLQLPVLTPAQRDALIVQLDQIETGIHRENLPATNSDAFYGLRASIDLIRERIGRSDAKALTTLRVHSPATS